MPLFDKLLKELRSLYPAKKADRAFLWFHENHTPGFKLSVNPIEYIASQETIWSVEV